MDTSIITAIISGCIALFGAAIGATGAIVAARITSKQKDNEKTIKTQEDTIASMSAELETMKKKESIYLDIIKEWTAKSKKSIKEDVESQIK